MKMITKMSKGFQLTIPMELRNFLNITKGSMIEMELNRRNNLVITKQAITEPAQEIPVLKAMLEKADNLKPYVLTIGGLEEMKKDVSEKRFFDLDVKR